MWGCQIMATPTSALKRKRQNKMKENRNESFRLNAELIFYIAIALLTVSIMLWYFLKPSQGNVVEVRVSGKVIGTYPLNENQKIAIEGKGNGENILIIKDGKVRMEEADCPDKICMKNRGISRVSESIICLPHEVVVEIKKNDSESKEKVSEQKEDEVDVIAK